MLFAQTLKMSRDRGWREALLGTGLVTAMVMALAPVRVFFGTYICNLHTEMSDRTS